MKHKHNAIIISILAVLSVAVTVLAVINKPPAAPVSGELAVVVDGEMAVVLTADDITALPAVELEKKIVDSSGRSVEGVFTGVPLRVLLDKAAPGWTEYAASVIAWGEDAYAAAFDLTEVTDDDNILLAYLLDGEPLGMRETGGSGPFRIVTGGDPFGTRSIRWVCRLEVIK